MISLRSLVPALLLVAGALPAVIFACNSSSSTLNGGPTNPGGGGDAGPSADGQAATNDSSNDAPFSLIVDSAPPDTSLPFNQVDAADIPEGGLAVKGGIISCPTQPTCNAFASVQCCVGEEGGTCLSTGVSCPPGAASITCNESADCVVGKVCCGSVVAFDAGPARLSAACSATCPSPPLPQLCRTNGECPDAGPCVVQRCSDGHRYEMCGLYSSPADASASFTCTPE